MPQLYASFTNSPIFVIVMCSNRKTMIGYFVNPSHIFNRPTLRTRVVKADLLKAVREAVA
jgi:hypothetical protein